MTAFVRIAHLLPRTRRSIGRVCCFASLSCLLVASVITGCTGIADDEFNVEERTWIRQHPVVLVAPEMDYGPFVFVAKDGAVKGLSVDYLDALADLSGLRFQMVAAAPLNANLLKARQREVDVLTSLKATTERLEYLSFTSSYVASPAVLIRRRNDHRSDEVGAAVGQSVAVGEGYAVVAFLRKAFPDLRLQAFPDDRVALRKVAFGEVDAAVVDIASATFIINSDGIANLRIGQNVGFQYELSFAYRKDWPLLGRVMEKSLTRIGAARRRQIFERWVTHSEPPWYARPKVVYGVAAVATVVALLAISLGAINLMLRRLVAQRTTDLKAELQRRIEAEEALRRLAEEDALTGLPNRRILGRELTRILALCDRVRHRVVVAFLDLSDFKAINDTYGHETGDAVLRVFAQRLQGTMRRSDLLVRWGGDEFVAVLTLVDTDASLTHLLEHWQTTAMAPIDLDGHTVPIRCSIGIAVFPDDSRDADDLVRYADAAMYRCKRSGRRWVMYGTESNEAEGGSAEADPVPGSRTTTR